MNRIQYTITGETLFKGIICSLISAEQTFEVKSTSRNLDGNGHHKGTDSWTYVIQMPAEAINFMPIPTGDRIKFKDLDAGQDLQSLAQSARDEYASDELEIDDEPRFSHGDGGSWVSAWVWVAVESDDEPYEVSLLDGGADVGSTTVHATSMEEAVDKATNWAEGGDWDHKGTVKLVVSKGTESESMEISVGNCGHVEYRPKSRGIPVSGVIDCSTCDFEALRARRKEAIGGVE